MGEKPICKKQIINSNLGADCLDVLIKGHLSHRDGYWNVVMKCHSSHKQQNRSGRHDFTAMTDCGIRNMIFGVV